MENPVLQIKDALIRVLKKIDPDTDVFFEEIKSTDPAHGVEQPKTWYFVDLKPGNPVTVDGIYTDMSVMVDVTYHEEDDIDEMADKVAKKFVEVIVNMG